VSRELADVLHYFLDDAPPPAEAADPCGSILAVAAAPGDVLRSAFAWNLAVALARNGTGALLVTPGTEPGGGGWPDPQQAPADTELIAADAQDLVSLGSRVASLAAGRPNKLLLVAIPPDWLARADPPAWLRWLLLFTTPDAADLDRTAQLASRVGASGEVRVGVTIHGVRGVAEARSTFLDLARQTQRAQQVVLLSYGLLVDDLDVYRAIVRRSAVTLEQPESRAARALRDVAYWIRRDARVLAR